MQAAIGVSRSCTDGHGFVVGCKGLNIEENKGQCTEDQNEFLHTILRSRLFWKKTR